jgi:hypothetical protein
VASTGTLKNRAQSLADLCLSFLAQHPEQLGEFMVQAGYDPAGLRRAVGSRQMVEGLLDHFAHNEGQLLAFCAKTGTSPEEFMAVWNRLNRTM